MLYVFISWLIPFLSSPSARTRLETANINAKANSATESTFPPGDNNYPSFCGTFHVNTIEADCGCANKLGVLVGIEGLVGNVVLINDQNFFSFHPFCRSFSGKQKQKIGKLYSHLHMLR